MEEFLQVRSLCLPRAHSAHNGCFMNPVVIRLVSLAIEAIALFDQSPDHSIVSFAGLGFLSLYLSGKLHLFDERGHTVCGVFTSRLLANADKI